MMMKYLWYGILMETVSDKSAITLHLFSINGGLNLEELDFPQKL